MVKLNKAVIFTGVKHCGKTTIATALAKTISASFYDMDSVLEDIYLSENQQALNTREIYKKGKAIFQDYETKAANFIAAKTEKENIIAAAGGGLSDNPYAIDLLKNKFIFIFIDEKPDILYKRIIQSGLPPFLCTENPYKEFLRLYFNRTTAYNGLADIKITLGGLSTEKVLIKVLNLLLEEGYAGK